MSWLSRASENQLFLHLAVFLFLSLRGKRRVPFTVIQINKGKYVHITSHIEFLNRLMKEFGNKYFITLLIKFNYKLLSICWWQDCKFRKTICLKKNSKTMLCNTWKRFHYISTFIHSEQCLPMRMYCYFLNFLKYWHTDNEKKGICTTPLDISVSAIFRLSHGDYRKASA